MKTEWLYTPDEWLNVPEIVKRCEAQGITFIYIVGGRGTGKTYGVFDYVQMCIRDRCYYIIKHLERVGVMTKEELNNLIVLNKNYKTGEPLFFVSYSNLFKITYDDTDSIKKEDSDE